MNSSEIFAEGVFSAKKVIRFNRLVDKVGVGRSTIYDWLNISSPRYDPEFPPPFKLSTSKNGAVGWIESDVDMWLSKRANRHA
ncbi:helix-turn-helix transcriptional regulator [Pseudomonas sp. W2-17]|uniref:helix-turn-helix transcriptional regulator n=1 Tax=Pseudomonas sp. W2-17 TaxID=3058039 RepID=UPI0034E08A74